MIGQFAGSLSLGAVGSTATLVTMFTGFLIGLSGGINVLTALYYGAKDKDSLSKTIHSAALVSLIMGVLLLVLGVGLSEWMLTALKTKKELLDKAVLYLRIYYLGMPALAIYNFGNAVYSAVGNTKKPLYYLGFSGVLNIILNLLFVWVFHWGVAGSATATMLARMFSMVTVLVKLRNPQLEIQLRKYFTIRPDWDEIKRILRIGVPSGVENSMFQFGKLAIQSTVSLMGTAAIAAQGMASIIENLNGIMGIGIGIGLMTVVGETLGAGRKEEAVYYVKKLCIVSEVVIIASCLLLYALVRPITYFGGMEPESAKMCIFMVTCITIVKPLIWVMAFVPAYGFRAAGDVKFTMTVSMLTMWLCRVTLSIVLARVFGFGPIAVWIGMFSDWALRGVIFTIRFRNRKWLNHHVI